MGEGIIISNFIVYLVFWTVLDQTVRSDGRLSRSKHLAVDPVKHDMFPFDYGFGMVAFTKVVDKAKTSFNRFDGFTIQQFDPMATTRLLLGILCTAFAVSIGLLDRSLLKPHATQEMLLRSTIVSLAQKEVGVREKTGHNDGVQVERYLAWVNLKAGQPYCAAFVSYIFGEAGLASPRSGWSPDMFPSSRLTKHALPADLLGIYFPEHHRIAHVGLIVRRQGEWLSSVEANTNINGSREGDGVYLKLRHIKTIYKIADWIPRNKGRP